MPLRVLHVVPSYLPAVRYGGPIQSVHGLCKALAARGHDVHVFTTNVDGRGVSSVQMQRPIDIEGVKVWYFATGLGRRLYRSPAMGRALERQLGSFDLVHTHSVFLWPTTIAARIARNSRIPYVISPRGMLVPDLIRRKSTLLKTAWINAFERKNVARAAAVHTTSLIEAEDLQSLGFAPNRVVLIPNGVELPSFVGSAAVVSNADRRPRVLSLGRISWKKGLDRLIAAMALVPDADLVIAGNDDENYQPTLEKMARDCGVAERTRFIGPVQGAEKWNLFRSCDVFVMASYSENFGIAALEAMACGRAVVLTQEVGLAKSVSDGGAGLVTSGDPASLGSAIRNLLHEHGLRNEMGANGERLAQGMYSWEGIAAQMERVYGELRIERQY